MLGEALAVGACLEPNQGEDWGRERHQTLRSLCPAGRLDWFVSRARDRGDEILVTELTTDELRDVGLRGFRALIPSLMPMSTVYPCRYLGSRRLREYNQLLGRPSFEIRTLNPEPQPFA